VKYGVEIESRMTNTIHVEASSLEEAIKLALKVFGRGVPRVNDSPVIDVTAVDWPGGAAHGAGRCEGCRKPLFDVVGGQANYVSGPEGEPTCLSCWSGEDNE